MELMDDDFGDLYVDVGVQASSVIGGLYIEPEENSHSNGSKSTEPDEKFFVDSVMEDTDSEDDLNIVLNDDDCEKFPVTCARSYGGGYEENENSYFGMEGTGSNKISRRVEPVTDGPELNSSCNGVERGTGAKIELNSHFKYVRPHGSSFSTNIRGNGHTGVPSFSSMSRGGEWEDDFYNQKKVAAIKSLPHQFGYGFSLPWYRTILGINIDAFEEKPWRHPSADITDFFNFGFNEDSWKEYCNSLEKFRQQSSRQAKIPSHYSSKLDQACEAEDVAKVESSLKCANRGEMLLELPKGRAIQVEESIDKRRPSMDIRRPRLQDSDVIIQITVQDSTVDSSDSAKEKLGHCSKSEMSEYGKLDAEDGRVYFSVSASSDELNGEHCASVKNVAKSSSLERSLQPACTQTSQETNDHVKANVSDMNVGCHSNMELCISEGIAEAIEVKNKENEVAFRNTHRSDTYITDREPSLDNRSHFSPTLSFSDCESEERSEDSIHAASAEIRSPLRSKLLGYGTELQKSVDHKSSRSDGHKTKSGDAEDFSEHLRDKQKHESWRHQHSVKQRILVESVDEYDTYRISDAEGGWERYQRHGNSAEEEWKHHRGRPHGIIDQNIHPENCYEASPLSNARELCYKDYSSVHCGRRKERSQDLVNHGRESSSYYREKEPYINRSKRFTDSHLCTINRKGYPPFIEDSDQFVKKCRNEKEFYHERRGDIAKEDDMDGFWCNGRRLPSQKSFVPRTYGESGSSDSRYSSASTERNIQWRRGDDRFQLRKKTDHGDCPLDYKHGDEWLKQKYDTSIPFTRDRGMVEPYDRCIPPIRRKVKASGREGRHVDASYFHLDRSGLIEIENEYRRQAYGRSLALATDREPSAHNGRRWSNKVSSRNKAYDSRLIERYYRHQRIVCHEEDRDGSWFSSYNYTDDFDFQNENQVQSRGRGCSKRSRVLHWREDKLLVNDRLLSQRVSFSCEKTSKNDLINGRHGSLQDDMLINDSMLEHHGYEMITEGSNATCHNRKSFIRSRGLHEEVLKDRDPVDLIVGEEKSSGRHSDSRSTICNGRLEKMGLEYPMEQKSSGRLLYIESTKKLDIEEGQIIHDEQNIKDINPEKGNTCETMMQKSKVKMGTLLVGNASEKNRAVSENKRILETLAKMEKRRERFKDPIIIKQEPDKSSAPRVESVVETYNETKQQRPARKRQWGVHSQFRGESNGNGIGLCL